METHVRRCAIIFLSRELEAKRTMAQSTQPLPLSFSLLIAPLVSLPFDLETLVVFLSLNLNFSSVEIFTDNTSVVQTKRMGGASAAINSGTQ